MAALKKFRPLFDRVLVERLLPETRTKGGIMIPEKAQGKVNEATVVATGPGVTKATRSHREFKGKLVVASNKVASCDGSLQPVTVQIGNKVLVPEYGGTKLTFDDKDYYLFRDADILGVFN